MNLNEVKDVIYDVVSGYFSGASVIWAEQVNTVPPLPYVTLKTGGVGRTRVPVVDGDDFNRMHYPSTTTLEVNLYTAGKPVRAGDGTGDTVQAACPRSRTAAGVGTGRWRKHRSNQSERWSQNIRKKKYREEGGRQE